MANDGNQIGQVSVGVTAVGVEETNRKLDSVAAHAKQTAAAVAGAAGGTVGVGGASASPARMTSGQYDSLKVGFAESGRKVAEMKAYEDSIKNAGKEANNLKNNLDGAGNAAKGMGQSLRESFQGLARLRNAALMVSQALFGWGVVVAVAVKAFELGREKLSEWGKELDAIIKNFNEIRAANEELAKELTEGEDLAFDKKMKQLREGNAKELQLLEERLKKEGWTKEAVDRAVAQRKVELDEKAQDAIDANQNAANQKQAASEIDAYDKVHKRRLELEDEAAMAGLQGVAKIKAEGMQEEEKLQAEKRRTQDETLRDEIDLSIEAVRKITAKKVEIQEKADKEMREREAARARDTAEKIAQEQIRANTEARAAISATWNGAQSQDFQEMVGYLKVIAEQTGRN